MLVADTVILSVCGKYKDFCASQSRTLIIDPIEEQKNAYEFISCSFEYLVNQMTAGTSIAELHK